MWKIFGVLAVVVSGLLLACSQVNPPAPADPGLSSSHWDNPAATNGEPPHNWSALEKDLKPEACAQCHSEQFNDWKKSLHAHAYSPGLIGQFPGMGHMEGNNCLNCHAPLAEQKYVDHQEMLKSLKEKLKQPVGFSETGTLIESELPLRHAGVTCAACHVRGWERFGPPQRDTGKAGRVKEPAHGGFIATRDFERSNFCASCHQFPQEYAINGKPLENTVKEWEVSRFAGEGVQCQSCHMPDRKHQFKGIHDPGMTRKGLDFKVERKRRGALLTIHSRWIGHAFPTYVTPKVVVVAEALDRNDKRLHVWQWEIIREVYYDDGWQEKRDTRLMPDETRHYEASDAPEGTRQINYQVKVIPDYFYKGVYEGLLEGQMEPDAKTLIEQAAKQADANDYMLFEGAVSLD
ncbi:MAG: multiheme c-type cytochrome [Mariprofundaceae bacterium]|nr:multiheme c-type cytochrome [Mariprofundaceae bacterium]